MTKVCNLCNEELPVDFFAKKKAGKYGVRARCKVCTNACERGYYSGNPEANKDRHLRKSHGITLEDYREMLAKQDNVCLICGQPETAKNKTLAVDHDHSTGVIRGLLCHKCNAGLGHFNDDPSLLRAAIKHLEVE